MTIYVNLAKLYNKVLHYQIRTLFFNIDADVMHLICRILEKTEN